jgi:hypothetical protein
LREIASVYAGFGDFGWWLGIDMVFLLVFWGNYFFGAVVRTKKTRAGRGCAEELWRAGVSSPTQSPDSLLDTI